MNFDTRNLLLGLFLPLPFKTFFFFFLSKCPVQILNAFLCSSGLMSHSLSDLLKSSHYSDGFRIFLDFE